MGADVELCPGAPYRRDGGALAGTLEIGCLLSRAAYSADFRSAAKEQNQLSPLQRVDPVLYRSGRWLVRKLRAEAAGSDSWVALLRPGRPPRE